MSKRVTSVRLAIVLSIILPLSSAAAKVPSAGVFVEPGLLSMLAHNDDGGSHDTETRLMDSCWAVCAHRGYIRRNQPPFEQILG